MTLFDSHCHFDFAAFDHDREQVWQDASVLGVQELIIPGVCPSQWCAAEQIAQHQPTIYFAVGLHPWWIQQQLQSQTWDKLIAGLAQNLSEGINSNKCVAIGECGLDAMIDLPMEQQQKVFDVHLKLAEKDGYPLIIHCRKAHNEVLQQLKGFELKAGGVIHGFSGSYEMAMQFWSMGFRLGIGGTITYERANKTRLAVQRLPIEAILLETDAPDMPIHGKQGERNSPVYLPQIAEALAELRGESPDYIAQQTTLNTRTLFKVSH